MSIYDDVAHDWRQEHSRPPPHEPAMVRAERWWRWHDRARAMTHALYADRGWDALVEGPACGVAMIEKGIAREVDGDEPSLRGAQHGIETALTDISTTLADALGRLPAPLRPLVVGTIPFPPKD